MCHGPKYPFRVQFQFIQSVCHVVSDNFSFNLTSIRHSESYISIYVRHMLCHSSVVFTLIQLYKI